jgi:hypothetical protein
VRLAERKALDLFVNHLDAMVRRIEQPQRLVYSDGSFTRNPAANRNDTDSSRQSTREPVSATAEVRIVLKIRSLNYSVLFELLYFSHSGSDCALPCIELLPGPFSPFEGIGRRARLAGERQIMCLGRDRSA